MQKKAQDNLKRQSKLAAVFGEANFASGGSQLPGGEDDAAAMSDKWHDPNSRFRKRW